MSPRNPLPEAVYQRIQESIARGPAPKQIHFGWRMESWQRELARDAAKRRNLSLLAYARRALMAWTAHDLGLDYYELMKDEAIRAELNAETEWAEGRGHGEWVIKETSD